jgi:hypothetical protein
MRGDDVTRRRVAHAEDSDHPPDKRGLLCASKAKPESQVVWPLFPLGRLFENNFQNRFTCALCQHAQSSPSHWLVPLACGWPMEPARTEPEPTSFKGAVLAASVSRSQRRWLAPSCVRVCGCVCVSACACVRVCVCV